MVNANNEHHPNRTLKYSLILLVIALLAYAAFFSWKSWRTAKSDELSRLVTITDLSEKAIDTYFTQLEIAMQSLGMDLAGTPKQPDLDRAFSLVSRFQALHTELGNILLIRADGQILLTGKTPHSRELPTLAKDLSFIKFRDELLQGPPFVIGQPVIGHIDNSWIISARYAVTDQTGKLNYILSANLPIDMLQSFWAESPNPRITALGLIRDDGYMVSRYPEPEVAKLDNLYGKPAAGVMVEYLRANNFPQWGRVEGPGTSSTDTAVQVMRRLKHHPVTLFVELPMAEIKAAWWGKVRAPYFLMVLMLAGILVGYSRSIRRRHAWSQEQRREENRRNYEQALHERSPNEIYMFDARTLQFTYVNDYALNNLGYTLEEMQKRTLLSLHPELSIESFANMIEPLRSGEKETAKYQAVQMRANGSSYPVEVELQLIASDDSNGFMAIINDITALNQAEENIRKFNAPIERRTAGRKSRLTASGSR
ncbi:MAG: PAS domain S-box protein [Gallionella sp.]